MELARFTQKRRAHLPASAPASVSYAELNYIARTTGYSGTSLIRNTPPVGPYSYRAPARRVVLSDLG